MWGPLSLTVLQVVSAIFSDIQNELFKLKVCGLSSTFSDVVGKNNGSALKPNVTEVVHFFVATFSFLLIDEKNHHDSNYHCCSK